MFIEPNGLSIGSEDMKIESFDLIAVVCVQVRYQLVQEQAGNPLLPVGGRHSERQNVTDLEYTI